MIVMEKPKFSQDQIVKSSTAAKKFGEIRQQAKINPIVISDNGNFDSVLVAYEYYEQMYARLVELERAHEEKVLMERAERLEVHPESAISWREMKQRKGK